MELGQVVHAQIFFPFSSVRIVTPPSWAVRKQTETEGHGERESAHRYATFADIFFMGIWMEYVYGILFNT